MNCNAHMNNLNKHVADYTGIQNDELLNVCDFSHNTHKALINAHQTFSLY